MTMLTRFTLLLSSALLITALILPAHAVPKKSGVYIGDSPAAQDMIKQALHLHSQRRMADAAAEFQKIIDRYPNKVTPISPDEDETMYIDVIRWARQFIANDKDLLDAYRNLHDPLAQRALEQATQPVLNRRAMRKVLTSYALCESGLEAGLRLAAVSLERAAANDAASVLDELAFHPDLKAEDSPYRPRWHSLQAIAGLLNNDTDRYTTHWKKIEQLGDDHETTKQLKALRESLNIPFRPTPLNPMEQLPTMVLPTPLGKPLWTRKTPWPPTPPVQTRNVRGVPQVVPSTGGMTSHILPAAMGDHIYINDGLSLVAFDRSSGQEIWPRAFKLTLTDKAKAAIQTFTRSSQTIYDHRGVAVAGDRLLAALGRVPIWPYHLMRNQIEGHLVCLDRHTGKELWNVKPSDLDPTLAGAFMQGTLVTDDSRVYVLLRRTQVNGFQDAFVMGVDIASGRLEWQRYLSSISGNRYGVPSLSDLSLENGRLYIADNLGSVSSIDASTGTMIWQKVIPQSGAGSINRGLIYSSRPGSTHVSKPILVEAGLIVGSPDGSTRAMLLDPDTGKELKKLPAGAVYSRARYLMKVGDDVLSVGDAIYRMDGKDPGSIKQRFELNLAGQAAPRHRICVTENRMIVPMATALRIFDLETGKAIHNLPYEKRDNGRLAPPGNVLVLDGQIVLATYNEVRSYVEFSRVQALLRLAMKNDPRDAQAGLSLAYAAMAARESKTKTEDWQTALLEGLDHSLAAINHRIAAAGGQITDGDRKLQENIFNNLLRFTEPDNTPDVKLRSQIFERVAELATTPKQEVAYRLTRATFLVETDKHALAVDHYQGILEDPTLSAQLYEHNKRIRQAGLESRVQLETLIKLKGRNIYDKYDTNAQQELEDLLANKSPDIRALQKLAEKYPLALVAPDARIAAANAMATNGDRRSAIAELRRAWVQSPNTQPSTRARIVGRLAELYTAIDQPWRARQWLTRAKREQPGMKPIRNGEAVSLQSWIAELSARPTHIGRLPTFELPLGKPVAIPGRTMLPLVQKHSSWPRNMVVINSPGQIHLHRLPDLKKTWSIPAPAGELSLLVHTDEQVLIWATTSNKLMAVDTQTGKAQWRAIDVSTLFIKDPAVAGDIPPADHHQPNVVLRLGNDAPNPIAAPARQQRMLIDVNDMIVCVANTVGQVVAIDRHTGKELWRSTIETDQLRMMSLSDEALALAGSFNQSGQDRGLVFALDPLSGKPLFDTIGRRIPIETPVWLSADIEAMVLYATQTKVVSHHMKNGAKAWEREVAREQVLTSTGQASDDLIMLQKTSGSVVVIDPIAGRLVGHVDGLSTGEGMPVAIRSAEDQWHMQTPLQVVAARQSGEQLDIWRDAISDQGSARMMQLIGRDYVVVLTYPKSEGRQFVQQNRWPGQPGVVHPRIVQVPRNPNNKWSYRMYLINRKDGRIMEERNIGPLEQAITSHNAVLLDNRLLLSTKGSTIIIPGGVAKPALPN